jgi:multidrug efflux pump subunit AcrB
MARLNLRPGRGFLSHFTRHGTLANLLMVVLIVAGIAAATRIRSQFFPDNVVGTVSVNVAWAGAGAEDMDRAVAVVMEPTLMGVEGVKKTSSTSREGRTSITLEFEPGWDMARAAEDVQTAVDGIRNLPAEAEAPEVRRGGWRDRVTDVVIRGPLPVEQLANLADEFTARLFAAGITRTTIQGVAAPETRITVTTAALMRHDISLRDISNAIAAEVQATPAGEVSGGAARVRTGSERRTALEIESIVLRRLANGTTLTIGDIATVEALGPDRVLAFFVGTEPAMTIRVDRADTGDAISMQAQVQKIAAEMQLSVPQGVSVDLIRTRAEGITDRLNILISNGLMGLGLVLALLFLFLNARTALWVAAGIPVAISASIAIMYLGGLTINMMSLFALIITLGIVVDDAIVVGEHADFRHRHLGEAPADAAERAAKRMFTPVFASTLTTVIAFMGLMVMGGTMGNLIADIPFTVIAVLVASLVECFLILPNHMAHALASSARERWYDWPSRQVNRGFDWFRARAFRPFIALVARARYPVLALAVLALAFNAGLFLRGDVQWRFFNAPEQGSITGNFSMLAGSSRDDTAAMMRELQRATETVGARYEAEHGRNPVAFAMGQIGGNMGRALAGADVKGPDLLGGISIELIDPDLRPYSSFEFLAAVQEEVRNHPKLEELSFRGFRFGPSSDSLSIRLTGQDSPTLKTAAEALKTALAPFPPVSGLEDTLAYDKPELVLTLTPQGEALGFSVETLGRALRERLTGIEAATFAAGPRSASIRVTLPDSELTADFLDSTLMRSPRGGFVPLADIVTVEQREGFASAIRENGLRVLTVTGDLSEDDPAAAAEVMRLLQADILPRIAEEHGIGFTLTGLAEQERDFMSDALLGLILCLLGIYLVLCWIFASWTRPLVIMAVIPFGLVGAIWGHYVWDTPMSMFSIVGLMGMVGIIINDSIVLITTIDEYARSRPLRQAIIEATSDRLRPVILTTLTTVLGLAPLLYESSSQALFLKPTVITLAYGLGFGMVLVLLVVPALVAAQSDIARAFASLGRGLRSPRRMGRGGVVLGLAMAAMLALAGATLGPAVLGSAALMPALAQFFGGVMLIAGLSALVGAISLKAQGSR